METINPIVNIVPLVPNAFLPRPAQARTRSEIPAGYGVQEQCLPFTAASALGFLIVSPIRFGVCLPAEVPPGCHPFRSPLDKADAGGQYRDPQVFYVSDNPSCRFVGNAYAFEDIPVQGARAATVREPGISFFDRDDQQDLFKLHLQYIWRTPQAVDTLFLPLLNRTGPGLDVLSGLVETDWYANPVNLILRKPRNSAHVNAGDPVAQAVLVAREMRKPVLDVVADHARLSRDTRRGYAEWCHHHAADRSAYKILARSHHGRINANDKEDT